MVNVNGKITGTEGVIDQLKKLNPKIIDALKDEMNIQSNNLWSHTTRKHLSGPSTTDSTIRARTGNLRRSGVPIITRVDRNNVYGGIQFGAFYSKLHVGKAGTSTTITGKPWLKIPLEAALTNAGNLKAKYSEKKKGQFFIKTKTGNLLLCEKKGKNDFTPLFILKKAITVPTRVHPEEILETNRIKIAKGFSRAIRKAIKGE